MEKVYFSKILVSMLKLREALFFVWWGGSLFCGRIFCGSPHLWEEKSVGEEKNVWWGEESVGWEEGLVGKKKLWEEGLVGKKIWWGGRFPPTDFCSHDFFLQQLFPPTKMSSHQNFHPTVFTSHPTFLSSPTVFSPTNEENHR